MQQSRKQFQMPTLRTPTKINYELGQGRYGPNVPNIGQAWSVSSARSKIGFDNFGNRKGGLRLIKRLND